MQNEIITLHCSVFITLFISYKSFISFYWMCCLAVIFIINLLTILLFITIYNVVAKFHSPMIFRNDIFLLATIIMGLRIYTFYSSISRSEQGTFSYKLFSMYKICKSGFNISEKKRIINKFRFYFRQKFGHLLLLFWKI